MGSELEGEEGEGDGCGEGDGEDPPEPGLVPVVTLYLVVRTVMIS